MILGSAYVYNVVINGNYGGYLALLIYRTMGNVAVILEALFSNPQ